VRLAVLVTNVRPRIENVLSVPLDALENGRTITTAQLVFPNGSDSVFACGLADSTRALELADSRGPVLLGWVSGVRAPEGMPALLLGTLPARNRGQRVRRRPRFDGTDDVVPLNGAKFFPTGVNNLELLSQIILNLVKPLELALEFLIPSVGIVPCPQRRNEVRVSDGSRPQIGGPKLAPSFLIVVRTDTAEGTLGNLPRVVPSDAEAVLLPPLLGESLVVEVCAFGIAQTEGTLLLVQKVLAGNSVRIDVVPAVRTAATSGMPIAAEGPRRAFSPFERPDGLLIVRKTAPIGETTETRCHESLARDKGRRQRVTVRDVDRNI